MSETAYLSACTMLARFREGSLSPVEAAEACLARIRAHNDALNAYCLVDEDATLAEARRAEERYRQGMALGLLDGVPVAVKDVFLIRGWPTHKASHTIDPPPPWVIDSPAVSALRRHGAVPLGMTTTPEFGWKGVTDSPKDGITRNPWDTTRTPGGSSGGSSAAVAAGMGPLALGTDAGGSVRIPAGFTGIFAHKPTQGLVPMWPTSPFGQLAHVGPMTWTVADAALMMDVLTEPDARDATLPPPAHSFMAELEKGVTGLKIAFSPTLGFAEVDPEIAAIVAEAVAVLDSLGAAVEEKDPGFADPLEAFSVLFYGGAANAMRDIGPEMRKRMDPGLVEVAEWAEKLSLLDYLGATNVRGALTERMNLFHDSWDLLVTPTLPIPAFEAGREAPEGWKHPRWPTWTPFTYPFNMTGQPACSVPCGFTGAGLPVGLQIVGGRHRDDLVLRAAAAYQAARPLTDRRPQLG